MSRPATRRRTGVHSLAWKLFGRVAACIVLVLAAILLLNTFALKQYYINKKQQQVSGLFDEVNAVYTDTVQLQSTLLQLQDSGTATAVLWTGRQLLFTTLNADRFRIQGDMSFPPGTYELAVVERDVLMSGDSREQAIRLIGTLDNGWHIYLRAPIAAIEESIAITNRFLLFTGGGALLVGLGLVLLVARQYADPVRQLAQVADRVAQLDFSGRYTGKAQDEIGDLGRSINTMSAALEQTITQLKNANARLTADIRQKEEQDRARQAFIANVSHELKTPLALISTYAEGLQEDIAAGGENRAYYCGVIEDEARRLTQLLRRMTMLMQLEAGGSQLEIERFDAAELLRNLLEKLRPAFAEKGVSLTLPPEQPVYVYADPYLIENVLQNYLSNALHHVNDGGCVAGSITPAATAGQVRLTVYNSGSHIPPEEQPHIWESFYKVDKAHTRAYGGSGIGLSVVAAIMKAHGMPYGMQNRADGVEFFLELETK